MWDLVDASSLDSPDFFPFVPGWDHLWIDGPLRFLGGDESPYLLQLRMGGTILDYHFVNDFDPALSYTWPIATAAGGIEGFDPARFQIDPTGLQTIADGTFALRQSDNSLQLTYTPVPEPDTALLLGLALLLAGGTPRLRSTIRSLA